jgi:hypothetical protein
MIQTSSYDVTDLLGEVRRDGGRHECMHELRACEIGKTLSGFCLIYLHTVLCRRQAPNVLYIAKSTS